MITLSLSGFREDIINSPIGTLVGKERVGSFIDKAYAEIRAQAKAGAEQAAPGIQAKVKKIVVPLFVGAASAGAVGLIVGIIAIVKAKRKS
jgi:hypothetical protein